jgi:hypothetical protein
MSTRTRSVRAPYAETVATHNGVELFLLLGHSFQYNLVGFLLPHCSSWLIKGHAAVGCALEAPMVYSRHAARNLQVMDAGLGRVCNCAVAVVSS